MWRWQKQFYLILVCLLCSSLIGANVARQPNQPPRVQPLLLQLAAEQPDQMLRVIVQTWTKEHGLAALVEQLGGVVTQELPMIHALVAETPARALPELARANGVRWVSLDAPVASTAVSALDIRINNGSDDAEEEGQTGVNLGPGGMYLISTDLELVQDVEAPSSGVQRVGLRFNGVSLPQGATITNAYLRFRAISPDSGNSNSTTADLTIRGQAADNATTFTTYANNVSARNMTAAAIRWTPAAWNAGTFYDSPNLAPIVQEIVSRPGWASGASMAFIIRCTVGTPTANCGSRSADSWNGSPTTAPLLHIEWDTGSAPPSPPQPPIFTTWATRLGTQEATTFTDGLSMTDSALGAVGTYGYGARVKGSFAGFEPEITPGFTINRVEVALHAYAVRAFTKTVKFQTYIGDKKVDEFKPTGSIFANTIGATQAGLVYVNITGDRTWQWADFANNLQIVIDQGGVDSQDVVYYDAIGLRVTTRSGVDSIGDTGGDPTAVSTIDASQQSNVYNQVIRATDLWNNNKKLQGKGVTVAVVDSGVFKTKDLDKRVRANVNFNKKYHDSSDRYGHGTFIGGLIAGSGAQSHHKYIGVAPRADVLNVRVSDDLGAATESDVISGLQWVLDNQAKYNIRVVNLSLNSSVAQSYHTSPLAAACEVLWFNGIVVVVSAGNNGSATLFPPANDPFVITVGATDDKGTSSVADDALATFSAYGVTESGFAKPELVAPGRNIIGLLPDNDLLNMSRHRASNRLDKTYFRMSGTSLSAPLVSGAVALLLQDEPNLTPDQVKYRLMSSANRNWPGYNAQQAGAGYLDIYAAVHGTSSDKANQNIAVSQFLWTNNQTLLWNIATEGSVSWKAKGSDFWPSIAQNSALNNATTWGSDYWEQTVGAAALDEMSGLKPGDLVAGDPASAEGVGPTAPVPVAPPAEGAESNHQLFLPVIDN